MIRRHARRVSPINKISTGVEYGVHDKGERSERGSGSQDFNLFYYRIGCLLSCNKEKFRRGYAYISSCVNMRSCSV